jgi:DNA-binding NarL/FixJ family response regulator
VEEKKVAELDSQGHSQPEIARILQISIGTVNSIAQENESDEEITNKVF